MFHQHSFSFKDAQSCYHDVKSRPKELQRTIQDDCSRMVNVIYKCFENRQKLLTDIEFKNYIQYVIFFFSQRIVSFILLSICFRQINNIYKEYEKIVPTILSAQKLLTTTEKELVDMQLQRQKDIWFHISSCMPTKAAQIRHPQFILGNPNINDENTQNYSLTKPMNFITGNTTEAQVNNVPQMSSIVVLQDQIDQLTLNKSFAHDTLEIINDNLHLRNQ